MKYFFLQKLKCITTQIIINTLHWQTDASKSTIKWYVTMKRFKCLTSAFVCLKLKKNKKQKKNQTDVYMRDVKEASGAKLSYFSAKSSWFPIHST